MIRHPASFSHHHGPLLGAASAAPSTAVPSWLRRAIPDASSLAKQDAADLAVVTGAAIGALDTVVRQEQRWAGVWCQRLALAAAATTVRQVGRVEDEAALRDAVLLTRPGDDVGPAGKVLLAWRRLVSRPAAGLLAAESLAVTLEEFGDPPDAEGIGTLTDELRQLGAGAGAAKNLTGAFAAAERHGFGRTMGAWLADGLLAQRLGWPHAVPLLGTEAALGIGRGRAWRSVAVSPAAGNEAESDRTKALFAAAARAALWAIDLSAELGRRADRLLAVAPKLRARASDHVIDRLLADDAMIASEQISGMSDRGLRRLFDRLIELGAIRELSGRPTFRIYGL